MANFKRLLRSRVPPVIRRRIQRWRIDRAVRGFDRRVVRHRYVGVDLAVEIADPLGAAWYDRDWVVFEPDRLVDHELETVEPLPELDLLCRYGLRPGARVFDLGAHQGVVGLLLGHRVGPGGQVVVVEPNPHNFAQCRRNIELNAMPWVVAYQAAAADREGTLSFNASLNGQAAELNDYGGAVTVEAVTVDGLARRFGRPDVVYVDVEGFECRVLSGAAATRASAADWFVEVHVGHGLEAAGGSADEALAFFPAECYERFVHKEGDSLAVALADASRDVFQSRFFLTAVVRDRADPI
jgi:FkbM family methyltransferase